jgi:hypothetical protein
VEKIDVVTRDRILGDEIEFSPERIIGRVGETRKFNAEFVSPDDLEIFFYPFRYKQEGDPENVKNATVALVPMYLTEVDVKRPAKHLRYVRVTEELEFLIDSSINSNDSSVFKGVFGVLGECILSSFGNEYDSFKFLLNKF